MDFRTFTQILLLRWKVAVAALLACLIGVGVLTAFQNKSYQASATILITFTGETNLGDAFAGTQAVQERLSSYAAIAGGQLVAQQVVDTLHLPITADALQTQTAATFVPKSQLITLTVTDTDPQRAAKLTGAMAEQFVRLAPTLGTGPHPKGPDTSPPPRPPAPAGVDALQDSQLTDAAQPVPDLPNQPLADSAVAPPPQQAASEPPHDPIPTILATIIERPEVPDAPVKPIPARNMAVGLIAGLTLGIGVALTRNATDHAVREHVVLEQISDVPTLAELSGSHSSAPRFGADFSSDDRVRGMRDRLLRVLGTDARRILMTAPFGGEGTTTTALNLALAFAELGDRVLIIEGDPRRATIAGLLKVDSARALDYALANPDTTAECVYGTSSANLFILGQRSARRGTAPCGAFPAETLDRVLATLSARFDRIVIDGPPILATADTQLLAHAVDGTVLVVRAGRTTDDEVRDALFALRPSGADVVGTVLTNASVARHTKVAARTYHAKLKSPK
ncbi:AAA family ATPase [Mycobacterium sp. M1]|uniref:AAA family ATPase n=1 Tax=Mycolicibacter acidiphilus TaxID=2835306 RepID=A0ABS5RHN5_9MYCO|nr:polysaccharide biosynthesis tyrosine autokinase [Mycolicibacter acidiphilus]MBS9533517.1 AAA family ATPase [Mycolicibacter acidiphilus]